MLITLFHVSLTEKEFLMIREKVNKNIETNKAVAYIRVSSREQEKGYSLTAQEKLLRKYAKDEGYEIVEIFREAMSAKKAGRKQFNLMLKYLKSHKDVNKLLVEKTDRITRNFKDVVDLDEIGGLELHFVKEGSIITEKSKSQDKMIYGLRVVLSKQYIDNLKEEAEKGILAKIEDGIYPSIAPVGYYNTMNRKGKHIIAVDEEKRAIIKKAFELYATGNYSAKTINDLLYPEGLTNRNGKKLAKSTVERMFKNIFYIGQFEFKGFICTKAQHEGIIDINTFNAIQERLGGIVRTRTHDIQFPYQGLFRCSICGGLLTPELKTKKNGKQYIYYHCNDSHKKGCKKLSYISQSTIDKIIGEFLKSFHVSKNLLESIQCFIKDIHNDKNNYQEQVESNITMKIEQLSKRIRQAYDDKCDGKIDEDFWKERNQEYHAERAELIEKLQRINEADEKFYDTCEQLLKFAKNAYDMFMNGTVEDKRFITQIVLSNSTYYDKKLDVELHPVFDTLFRLTKEYEQNKSTIEPSESIDFTNKKDPKKGQFVNGGNDEARTRDLMRDRHAL